MPQKNPPIETILVECAIATGRGLGTKKASPGAADFWTGVYKKSIANALHNGGVWTDDRNAVLLMALKLGRRAKLLAATKTVTKANAKKASKIIAADPTCGAGGGRYCPPST